MNIRIKKEFSLLLKDNNNDNIVSMIHIINVILKLKVKYQENFESEIPREFCRKSNLKLFLSYYSSSHQIPPKNTYPPKNTPEYPNIFWIFRCEN